MIRSGRTVANRLALCTLLAVAFAGAQALAAPVECERLAGLELSDARIERASRVAQPVAHCKVDGLIGGRIGFSVWLPERWNERFLMGGAGGFVGPDDNQALMFVPGLLEAGYATASTNTGHVADGMDASWALDDFEAIVNYGHLGMHRAVVLAKAVIAAHYGKSEGKAFFLGCSNGGRQALMEAQRYPTDFDAIVAGAPALNLTGVASAFVEVTRRMYPDPASVAQSAVSPDERKVLGRAVLDRCDRVDGVADGILNAPADCDFDPASLACPNPDGGPCFDPATLDAIASVYGGPQAGSPIFFGFPFGAEDIDENGWGTWLAGTGAETPAGPTAAWAFGLGVMRYFAHHDPAWTYVGYDATKYIPDLEPVSASVNADSPDLDAFRARGGKLLMFHGWADVALTAHMATDYAERVYARDAAARDDVRLFMMPGVLHCAGGPGPSAVDWLGELARWHDSGVAPGELIATWPDKPGARKLCAWPQSARYMGGEPDQPQSWQCE